MAGGGEAQGAACSLLCVIRRSDRCVSTDARELLRVQRITRELSSFLALSILASLLPRIKCVLGIGSLTCVYVSKHLPVGDSTEMKMGAGERTFIQHMQYAACRLNLRSAEPTKIRSEGGKEKGSSASSLSYRSCSRDKGNSGTVRKKLRLTPLYDLLVGMLVVGGVGGSGR
uniref:Uncharacterized protein n=1 Tax=Vespula pensylvanica TaxID=30213 RepID=A0A834P2K3_VESPE|nr:hypothetical protein H0235_008081 [Vespula pensylvanica]